MFKDAKWIWAYSSDKNNEYCDFVDTFESCGQDRHVLRISSDTNYEFYINGIYVQFGQYADFPAHKHFDEIDISQYIVKGKNIIAIKGYCHYETTQTYVKGGHGIIYEVESEGKVLAFSGAHTLGRVSLDYFSGDIYKFSPQLGYSFKYYGDRADGWEHGQDLAEKGFKCCVVLDYAPKMSIRPIKKLEKCRDRTPILITQGIIKNGDITSDGALRMQQAFMSHRELDSLAGVRVKPELPVENGIKFSAQGGDGVYLIVDLGSESAGSFTLDMEFSAPVKVDVGYGEHLDDLRVRSEIEGRNFFFEITCPAGRFKYTNNLRRIGTRYLQLFVYTNSFTLYDASVISTNYPITVKDFYTDNYLRACIYDTGINTLRLCMHEHYEDTPWREQALYSYDSRNQMLFGYYAFEEKEFARANLVLLSESLRDDGLLEISSPSQMPFTIPVFSAVYLLQVKDYLDYTGDTTVLQQVLPACSAIVERLLLNRTKSGLIGNFTQSDYWNFYEWSDGLNGMPITRTEVIPQTEDMILSCFTVCALKAIAQIVGDDIKKRQYLQVLQELTEAIDLNFWDEKHNCYVSYIKDGEKQHFSEYANAMALYANIGSADRRAAVADLLMAKDSGLIKSTLSARFYMYEGLMLVNGDNLSYILDDIDKIWGKMMFNGATAFYETELGADDFYYAGSLCHGWSALPVYFYKKYL